MDNVIPFPFRPAQAAPRPVAGFGKGDRVWDTLTGRRGVVIGFFYCATPSRPLKYAVRFDGAEHPEDVLSVRLVPAKPVLASTGDGPSLTTLNVRRISRAPWWPGKDALPEPEGAA